MTKLSALKGNPAVFSNDPLALCGMQMHSQTSETFSELLTFLLKIISKVLKCFYEE